MNSAMAKTFLSAGLIVIAASAFHAKRSETPLEYHVPRVVRDMERCVATGDMEELAIIIKGRPDLVNLSMAGGPPLHVAARFNQAVVVDYLLKHGADRYARGGSNGLARCTALHWACLWGSKEAAEVMLDRGFEVEDRNDLLGSTPLHWAALGSWEARRTGDVRDYEGLVQVLIDHGAAVDTYDNQGKSAVSIACDSVAKVLKEYRARPGAGPSGRTY
jgi:ankyrin repeat protein